MAPEESGLIALALGVLIGLAIAGLFAFVWSARVRAAREVSNELPQGLRETLAALDDASCVMDPSGVVVAASDSAADYRIVTGNTLPSERLRQLVRLARDADEPAAESLRLKTTDDSEVLVAARATKVSPRLVVLMMRDVSAAERLEQMRTDFVTNTGHELKTPIGAISLLAEAVDSAADDPDQVRRFAGRIQTEAGRLAQLSARIMNLAYLESADALRDSTPIRIAAIVDRVIDAYKTQADAEGITLARGAIADATVLGDQEILADAVGNLVANAIAYSPEGSRVAIAASLVGDTVEVLVADQGIGIAEPDRDRIFERFYRADEARSRATGGSGLGLSIVKHAAQRHGGSVRVWSVPGRGSTFTIALPLAAQAETPATKTKKKKKAKKGSSS